MKNGATKKVCPGAGVQATRLDRVTAKMERLKLELSQARARRQEEAARQERIAKLRQRQRLESEQRYLGHLCRLAGLDNFRHAKPAESVVADLDAELIAGALQLLSQQVRECASEDLGQLRASGRAILGEENIEKSDDEVSDGA